MLSVDIADPWFESVCQSYENPPVFVDGQRLPGFPPDQVQIQTTGLAGRSTLRQAFVFHEDCITTFSKHGAPVRSTSTLLDFGVGWGRIARFFLRELPLRSIHGVDVSEDSVAICRETFGSENFTVTPPFPPTALPNDAFSHIVGYSVFSHLSEKACLEWMQEFHRLMPPGGVVALTTRGRWFFRHAEERRPWIFDNFDEARSKYDRGEFVHWSRDGGSYGETFIPKAYAERAYADMFELLEFQSEPPRQGQPIMFFRRR